MGSMLESLRTIFKPLTKKAIALVSLMTRPMTLGVRTMVFDEQGRIFLVRHSYVPGWYLPGGGVDAGETLAQAAVRELREEGNIHANGPLELFGVYLNAGHSRRNHVALYIVRDWNQPGPPKMPGLEIVEVGFFDTTALPETTTAATRRRIAEVLDDAPRNEIW
ncbi:NUDIX domain-containing protein [Breoghania sp. L-A4]|uniref:NUDIX domain-containing protein n=1 Tax=Breoghania sp. L-A4 TaxID=2304600 RepID=UPI000E3606E0|nr:NUDIX domain-containing protein [Breoghania sp. L-A4]AXS41472.1 NUDIX domain-containing protein [Breoghania sp. L-A4]